MLTFIASHEPDYVIKLCKEKSVMERQKNKKHNRSIKLKRKAKFNENDGYHNDAGPTSVKKTRNEATNPISFRKLLEVLNIDNEAEFILKLSSGMNGFLVLLDQLSIRSDLMCLILAALAKASNTSSEQSMAQLLVHFYMQIIPKLSTKSNFNRELKLYIADLCTHLAINSSNRQKHVEAVRNLLIFLRRLQLTIYQKSYEVVSDLMQLITAQIDFINRKGNSLDEDIIDMIEQLNKMIENFTEMKKETEKTEALMEPPNDFREVGIYPDKFDILGNHEPFIRKNLVEGKYVAGVDHYLDVQFRLLREDFVRPLRNGIIEYRHIINQPGQMAANKFRINDLNIYKNVQIYESKMIHNDQIHLCRFDCKPFGNLRWEYNKRMIAGSLVCLSPDHFETFFFATVAGQRNPLKLTKGEFEIRLETESSLMTEITPLNNYVMVESQVYFEAYRHNLKVLQGFGKDNFPLEKYIVDVDKNISPPKYLNDDTVYQIPNGLSKDDPNRKISPVQMLSNQKWPPREDFRLDESQYEAFRAALTKQMAIIQGPPGTGKTYIGLRIVEVLLANTSQFPILIVCYTNHALDQFLEGILKYCDAGELVRIGGKSQCVTLAERNLSHIKSVMMKRREVANFIHNNRRESKSVLNMIQNRISNLENDIKYTTKSLLGNALYGIIQNLNQEHYPELIYLGKGSLSKRILKWFGYVMETANEPENNINSTDGENEVAFLEQMYEELEMDEEEVRELENQRFIDDSILDEEIEADEFDFRPIDVLDDLNDTIPIHSIHAKESRFNKMKQKSTIQKIQQELGKTEVMPQERAATIKDIKTLSANDRWNLYRLWIKLYVQEIKLKIKNARDAYRTEYLRFNGLQEQEDIEIVKRAKIIGMTTTGAAKYRHIIDGTKPKIAIVEEAAEVLEAHIVTALCNQTEHLILIGDHLQLRPNPAVYELAKKFNLEISLFERMIKNQMQHYQLKEQHRMRPCISSLLVPHIYKQLIDHPSVKEYENVKGISKNMYFINHHQNEMSTQETRSHLNKYEAELIVELCRYIVLQGYETSQVTILTTYSGQLHQIRQLMRSQHLLTNVRATVVDNYQGEESDIILLSFVRSNDEGNIGFLKDAHRINVALSRAKKGLYCIGNFDCLAEKSELWQKLMVDLKSQDAIGNALEIYCQNHTDYRTLINASTDFNRAPEGGCMRPCNDRLPCGHACTSVCHIIDLSHTDQYKKCPKKCEKIMCEREHRCQKRCHYDEECGKCEVRVDKLRPDCKHVVRAKCSGDPNDAFCNSPCERKLNCGHKCKSLCGMKDCDTINCAENVEVESPCGHTVTIKCSDAKDILKVLSACDAPCGIELKCGHLCKGSCGKYKSGRLHISCKENCSRILICGHPCPDKCSVECAPCKQKCSNSCAHSKCNLLCGEPCAPCMEKCNWHCKHLKCTKLCHEPCDRELCEHPHTAKLKCKHPPIGICGERVPRLCRVCDEKEVKEIFFGDEDEQDARFIELVDCKHVIEVKGLIQWMQSESKTGADGNSQKCIRLNTCPKCKTIIRNTRSLNTFIQASLKNIEQVKLITRGKPMVNKITQRHLNEKVRQIIDENVNSDDPVGLYAIYRRIHTETGLKNGTPPLLNYKLDQLNSKFELVQRLREIWLNFDTRQNSREIVSAVVIEKFIRRVMMAVSFIRVFTNSDQQREDILNEIAMLQIMSDVIIATNNQPFNEIGRTLLNDAFTLANQYGSADESVRNEFKRIVNEAIKHSSGLGISMEEKDMIIKAMDSKRGSWYTCQNGHIYNIGDCGGAVIRSKCQHCKSNIGGENHQLDRTNFVSTEMDGATAPAWPQ